ncbi:MAG: CotH kinase family protein [Crocinitomicaceae bacterium]|nr:CotH kinase family protein [Crocinitomicaceae bacterium]
MRFLQTFVIFCFLGSFDAQVLLNEGCNKNAFALQDENGDAPDWIELYNNGSSSINLENWKLADQLNGLNAWIFPNLNIPAQSFMRVFCSGKDRYGSAPFTPTANTTSFQPVVSWNTHPFSQSFNWDGSSNIIVNVCSYNNSGYTENSVFYQSATPFVSCVANFVDGSAAACSNNTGQTYYRRPNIKLNNAIIGNGTSTNGNTEYPAPYGNWYWGARHQMLILASEMQAAGLIAGPISSLSFQVASTNGEFYDYIDIALIQTSLTELESDFLPLQGQQLHTNFKLDGNGEHVYLFNTSNQLQDQLEIRCPQPDISVGRFPNGSTNLTWMSPSPGLSNNGNQIFSDTLTRPQISLASGIYNGLQSVQISTNIPNTVGKLVYTINGQDPTINSATYVGPISVSSNQVLRAKVFPLNNTNLLPSEQAVATYLFGISHTTPILLVNTPNENLFGATGIFDNWWTDWVKPAYAVLLDTGQTHPILHQTKTALRMDGGAGGSRSQPQHSFRLSFTHGTFGDKPIAFPLLPDRPNRTLYSDIYLRNGSNQYLNLPYKDASQVRMMSEGSANYYSSYRPVSVYINGAYFGLYELREKFNQEYFEQHDNATRDSIELLSLSYWYNLVLRAVEGDVDNFWADYNNFNALAPSSPTYWQDADQYFDLKHYTDYIIAESWMGNVDWPGNNIKIYRSDASQKRWRFALIDLELSMQPNGWTNCTDNHIAYMMGQSEDNPYINIWKQSIENLAYRNYFINRFADQMNTSYRQEQLLATEQSFYESMLPEMPQQFARWGDPNNIAGQMATFEENHNIFRDQLVCRSTFVFNQLRAQFNLTKKVQVSLQVYPEMAGQIHLNTIQPTSYPWSGTYFDGVPIYLQPVAAPGYVFSHWLPAANILDSLSDSLEVYVNQSNQTFTAVFNVIPLPPDPPYIEFSVQPNPSNGLFSIISTNKDLAKDCQYVVCDLQGRVIQKGPISDTYETSLDLTAQRAAVYWLRIYKGEDVLQTLELLKF